MIINYDFGSFNDRFDGIVLAYGDGQLINDYTDRMGYCICKHLGNDFYCKNTSGANPKIQH